MSTNNPQEIDSHRGYLARLVVRLFVARAHMAPHQEERDNGKLILACCEYLGGLALSIDHIEEQLMDGARIVKQDGKWQSQRSAMCKRVCLGVRRLCTCIRRR
jgi:hypothetical protein